MFQITKKDIILLKQHDEITFIKFRKHYINPICLFLCTEFKLTRTEAIDLAEDIFIKAAYIKIHLYDWNKSSFSTWLFKIAKNYCIDYIKDNVNVSYCYSNKNVEDLVSTQEEFEIFYDIQKFLDKDEYAYLICYFVYEMTIDEIATKYSVNKSTVCRKIKHAKNLIKLHREELSI